MLWMAGFIAHYDQLSEWFSHPLIFAATVAAALAVFFPTKIYIVGLALFAQVLAWWHQMPLVDNHWFAVAYINIILLILFFIQIFQNPSEFEIQPALWAKIQSVLRPLVILIYVFAVFYKLNLDFFDPNLSCAVSFYTKLRELPIIFPLPEINSGPVRLILIAIIFLWELSIPILLSFRRTWAFGLFVGLFFHSLTSPFLRHFPSVMLPLYLLFVPAEVWEKIVIELRGLVHRVFRLKLSGSLLVQFYALLWPTLFMLSYLISTVILKEPPNDSALRWVILRLWALCFLGTLVLLLKIVIQNKLWKIPRAGLLRKNFGFALLAGFIFSLNALSPLIGLKTSTSFAMWSNFEIGGTQSNHLLFSNGPFHLFPYLKDFVVIKTSNSPSLNEEARLQTKISLLSLRRRLEKLEENNPGRIYEAEFLLNDRALSLAELKQIPLWDSYWVQKIVYVHDLPHGLRGVCRW